MTALGILYTVLLWLLGIVGSPFLACVAILLFLTLVSFSYLAWIMISDAIKG